MRKCGTARKFTVQARHMVSGDENTPYSAALLDFLDAEPQVVRNATQMYDEGSREVDTTIRIKSKL